MKITELKALLSQVEKEKRTELDISLINIGDEGAEVIGEWLKNNTSLTSLDLFENNISRKVGKGIYKAIESNKQLVKETLKFLVNKFITQKEKISVDEETKHFNFISLQIKN